METYIEEFHEKFYITAMKNIELILQHVGTLGTHHCIK